MFIYKEAILIFLGGTRSQDFSYDLVHYIYII